MYHTPVLLSESIEGLNVRPDGIYVDATFGGGGHSKAILKTLVSGKLIAFDQDKDAVKNLPDDDKITLINQNFRWLKRFLRYHNCIPVHGILADLGVSSHQFDTAERGFSSRFNGPIDLRMDNRISQTGADILNKYTAEQLSVIFKIYGEIKQANRLANKIISKRNQGNYQSMKDLMEVLQDFAPKGRENKFFARVLQALRITINDELNALKELLLQSLEVLDTGGRLVVITYHSLEDRIVKNFLKSGNFKGELKKDFYGQLITPFKTLNHKPISAGEKELEINSRARSAKLRIAEKKLYE